MNGIDFLDKGWSQDPAATCMIDGVTGERFSYEQVRAASFRNADALRRHGFDHDAKASIISHNAVDSFIAVLSIMRAGMSYIPVNARNTLEHNTEILGRFDCEILFLKKEFLAELPMLRQQAPNIREFVCIDGSGDGVPSLDEWTAGASDKPFDLPHDSERTFEILPTSATTGFPKGVVWLNRQLESIVANFRAVAPIDRSPIFLAVAPLTHLSGKFMNFIMSLGGTGVIVPNADRQMILRSVEAYRVTHLFLPPTLIYDLLTEANVREFDYSSLRYFMYSAAPMAPAKLAEAIEVFGPVMCQIYGQSEAAWLSALLPVDHFIDGKIAPAGRLASCGRPLPFVNMEVMDDAGNLLDAGQRGELVARGSCVMREYYKDPEKTNEAFTNGWLRTGDIGYRDSDGFFYIVDRKKDMIISGGFNIYSVEVEGALLRHEAVQGCAVIGIPDDRWGEKVAAYVELKAGRNIDTDALIEHCRAELGAMKAPKVLFIEALPRSPIGKVLKRTLRDRHWGSAERQVH